MYRALWRILPGPVWAKVGQLITLALLVLSLLFFVVFPWAQATFLVEESTVG